MKTAELLTVAGILRDAARAEILPRFRDLAEGAVKMKTGPLDLVTEADEAAERQITAALRRAFPGCVVVGEEAASANPALLADLAGADLAFVVDPVDGTANFAAGLALFGVMAAVMRRGEIIGAVIHDPIGDDHALASRGEGAWIETPDGKRRDLHVAAPVPVGQMCGNVSWRFMPVEQRPLVTARLPRLGAGVGLPLLRSCLSDDGRGPWAFSVLLPAVSVGPRAGLAAAPGGRGIRRDLRRAGV